MTLPADSTVAVIGAGAMGAGIAQVAAAAGHPVKLFDAQPGQAATGKAKIGDGLTKLVAKAKLSQAEADAILHRIGIATNIEGLKDAHLVIEAIVEDFEIKKGLFQSLETILPPDAILTTNTSSLSVTRLAEQLKHPHRFSGLHFFNPAPIMPLVEVVHTVHNPQNIVEALVSAMIAWGKTPVRAKDAPGFIVNKGARPFYGEPLKFLEETQASPGSVDAVFRANGFKMGPLELIDLIGLDINLAASQAIYEAYGQEPRYAPSALVEEYVQKGWLGRKSRRGFYDYSQETQPPAHPTVEAIFERTMAMLVNEAADTLERGIATAPEIDTAMRLGLNWPFGPFTWANELSTPMCAALLQTHPEPRYRVTTLLKEMAERGESFQIGSQ